MSYSLTPWIKSGYRSSQNMGWFILLPNANWVLYAKSLVYTLNWVFPRANPLFESFVLSTTQSLVKQIKFFHALGWQRPFGDILNMLGELRRWAGFQNHTISFLQLRVVIDPPQAGFRFWNLEFSNGFSEVHNTGLPLWVVVRAGMPNALAARPSASHETWESAAGC